MKIILLSLACLSSAIMNSQTFEYLDINQVKARVNSGGDLHWDPATGNSAYECPKGSSKTWGGPASLWIGGLDAGNQLHLAAQTYHQSGTDFWPGPLSTNNATTNSVTVNQYNRVWKLNKSDIDDFITNYANGNVQNGSYTPVADLLSWPGNGDMSQNQDVLLAPFMDVNADDVYSPMDGDYPIIKGDQAIFTIFNDNYLPHQNTGAPAIGLEIRLMAYAYAPTNTLVTGNPSLNYTTFYNYAIINRSPNTLYNAQISLFNDSDIGNYMDDYVGCNVTNAYAYTYNNITSTVTNQPAIGIKQTMGPVNTTNAIDDNHDGMIDEPGEQMCMTNFMYFNNSFPGIPIQTTDPGSATDYFQYMNSIWKDGTPLTCGGNGYGGNIPINYAYPASSYFNPTPCGAVSWRETDAGSDKKFVMSSGQTVLLPGSFTEVEYAYITAFDSITNDPLSALSSAMNALRTMQNSSVTGIKEQPLDNSFTLSPNPTNGILNISSSLKTTGFKIEVIDALGKVLISEDHKDISQTSIHVENLSSGIYFVKLVSGENTTTKKFIKE